MRAILFLAAFLLPATLPAQSAQPDLEALLLHKQLYLRGLWEQNQLQFNATGQLEGKAKLTSFTLAAFDINKVELKPDRLELKGNRVGLFFDSSGTHFISVGSLNIRIAAPPGGDYQAPLDAVLSDLPTMLPILPDIWQTYAAQHFKHGASNSASDDPPRSKVPPFDRTSVQAPVVTYAPKPAYNSIAKEKRVSGSVLVYLQVSTAGSPVHIRILHPLGMGLDEQAAHAVSQYKFKPALENGTPVAVEMNVEVNFQVF